MNTTVDTWNASKTRRGSLSGSLILPGHSRSRSTRNALKDRIRALVPDTDQDNNRTKNPTAPSGDSFACTSKSNLSFLSDDEKRILFAIGDPVVRAVTKDAIDRLNWRESNIAFVTMNPLKGWRTKDLLRTTDQVLTKVKTLICRRSRVLQDAVRIKGLIAHETRNRQGGPTDPHVHMLLTIEGIDFPPILEMLLWELLNQDARFNRDAVIGRNLTEDQRRIAADWIAVTKVDPDYEIAMPITCYTPDGKSTRNVILKRRTAAYGRAMDVKIETRRAGNPEPILGDRDRHGLTDYTMKSAKRSNRHYDHIENDDFVTFIEV